MEMNTKSPTSTEFGREAGAGGPAAPGSRELLLATVGMLALLLAFDLLGQSVGWVGSNLLVFVAGTFLLLPDLLWPAGRTDPDQAERPWREKVRGIAFGALVGLVLFVGFVPGFHLWNTRYADRAFAPSVPAFHAPANELNLHPATTSQADLTVERDGRDLLLHWQPVQSATLALNTDGVLALVSGSPRPASATGRALSLEAGPDRPVALRVRVEGASEVRGSVSVPTDIWLGSDLQPKTTAFAIPYSLRWIPWMLLMQIVLVAIPEETFFRGYLLRRLALRWPEAASTGFFHISRANLVASAVFALAHFVIGFHPGRLAVFFPSLLFGRLAERTGGLSAAVTVHVLSNLMMQLLSTQYLP